MNHEIGGRCPPHNYKAHNGSSLRVYLDSYGESIVQAFESEILSQWSAYRYRSVLAIPIYDEPLNCLEQVLPNSLTQVLVIGVVNIPESADPAQVDWGQRFLSQFISLGATAPTFMTIPYGDASTIVVVDCCRLGRRLAAKGGVGLARKVGGDLALAAIERGIVSSPWIHCTDADVQLPPRYFDSHRFLELGQSSQPNGLKPPNLKLPNLKSPTPNPLTLKNIAVALYPFQHYPPHPAILCYEIWLRYYVTQLVKAGSPYGFHTIGSLLKIQARAYAGVRGFPKRQAGEDFYMLNKLAKVGTVVRLSEPMVQLSSRRSHRVPFGTGAAMTKLAQDPTWLFYHPDIFGQLQKVLQGFEQLWYDRNQLAHPNLTPDSLTQWWQQTDADPRSLIILEQLGFPKALSQAYRQTKDWQHFQRFLATWFDGFRTLKFVHLWRDYYQPSLPLTDLSKKLWPSFFSPEPDSNSLEFLQQINQHLIRLENHFPSSIGPTLLQ